MRTLRDVYRLTSTTSNTGLTSDQVLQSRQQFGANKLTPLPKDPIWKKFLEKFDEPIIKILLAAALLSILVELFKPPLETLRFWAGGIALAVVVAAVIGALVRRRHDWIPAILFAAALVFWLEGLWTGHASVDGFAVMVAVILATGVAFASEYKSDREFELLIAHKESLRVKVNRGDNFCTVDLEEVVVGDLIILGMGDEIPADGRLVKATSLYVDQSLITGEAEPVHKQTALVDDASEGPEQHGCLYRGTHVVDGLGEMVVTEVGDATYLGQIARRLSSENEVEDAQTGAWAEHTRVKHKLTISKELTPLQRKLENLAGLISKVGYVAALAIFLALFIHGLHTGEVRWPTGEEDSGMVLQNSAAALLQYFMYMVIIIVVAVPEGLPMSVTVSLALAMRKMTRANSLVRQLVACETIGSASVICSDKTGTMTQNKMQVVRRAGPGQALDRGAANWAFSDRDVSWSSPAKPLDWMVLNAALNSTANLEEKGGKLHAVGNSTEGALLYWLHEAGLNHRSLRRQFQPLYQIHFTSDRKLMTTVIEIGEGLAVLTKGASEWVLEQTTHYQSTDGTIREWTLEAQSAVRRDLDRSAGEAMRTLGFAHARLPAETRRDSEFLHSRRDTLQCSLVFDGFIAIRDPLREDVKEAVAQCRQAGIDVKMITGDNVETARAIGLEIGLLEGSSALVLTSQEFNALDDAELKSKLPKLRILARARPLDKFRMVKLLQEEGEIVAVTGDGTNDAPALKKADVGLAMGCSGSEVAKEASKIVLLDDAFSTIVKAIHWGRALYENIQRFIQFQLTINVSALVIAFLGPFFGVKPPFTILQLLWINVIMDTLASIALCSEPPRKALMLLPPKRRDENILTRAMLWNIFSTAAFLVVMMMTLLLLMKGSPDHPGLFASRLDEPVRWSGEFPEFTVRQVSIFFTVYVLFQVWNEVNCRSLVPEVSGLHGLFHNRVFLGIIAVTVVVQVLIVSLGGAVFHVEPLGVLDWLAISGSTASILLFTEVIGRLRLRFLRRQPNRIR
jgi:Ca2+-transporting ATPase